MVCLAAGPAFFREASAADVQSLIPELEPFRLTEGRLGQIAYAPFPTPLLPQGLQLIAQRAGMPPRERVLLYLAAKNLGRAITHLEEVTEKAPGDALLLSDLSSLYGERARAEDRPDDYVASLEMADRAVSAVSDSAEANFNRALALEHLFLYEEASRAWVRYLQIEDSSPWADEARTHLEKLAAAADRQPDPDFHLLLIQAVDAGHLDVVAELASEAPEEAREVFEIKVIPKWAESIARGSSDPAARRLAGARVLAETLAKRGGDRSFLQIVEEMEEAAGTRPERRTTNPLIHSLQLLRVGQEAMEEQQFTVAERALATAETDLRAIHSAAAAQVLFLEAICQAKKKNVRGAEAALRRLGHEPSLLANHPSLEARRQLWLGFLAQRRSAPTDALAYYQRALPLFISLGEFPNTASIQHLMSESLGSLGRPGEAWRYWYRTLEWARKGHSGREAMLVLDALNTAVTAALAQRRPEAALDFQTSLLQLARASDNRTDIVDQLLRRARIKAALGRREEARKDFARIPSVLEGMPLGARERLAARLDLARSEIAEGKDLAAAIAFDSSDQALVPRSLSARIDFDFQRGDTVAAESGLERSLEELERRREKVAPGSDRISFFDQAQPMYERMIALQLHLGRPEKGFEALERFRARTLLDQLQEVPAHDERSDTSIYLLSWETICRRVPEHTVIVVYAVVDGRLVTWLVRAEGILLVQQQPIWSSVSSLVQAKRRNGSLEQLRRSLIAPWQREVPLGDRIVFVPTRTLFEVPFAAFRDPASGRFLIEDHPIAVAPSASGFLAALEHDRTLSAGRPASVLLVGDPAIDPFSRDRLPRLRASEIDLLSGLYRGLSTRVLKNSDATPARVLSALGQSDIVHLAVHSVPVQEDPARSHLVLASGNLTARDILGLRLPRTRLVVLAACGTQAGPVSPSEGSLSLSSAFLAAGVPAVVGSLWPVDDASTARLSVRLHQEILRGADPMVALRTAQLAELDTVLGRTDWTWASFEVFGGVAAREPKSR